MIEGMIPHIVLCVLLVMCSLIENKRNYRIVMVLALGSVICFEIFSDTYWGIDSRNYETSWYIPARDNSISVLKKSDRFAIPFLLWSKVICFFSADYKVYKVIMLSVSLIIIASVLIKITEYRVMALSIMICICASQVFFSFRQMTAFGIFFISMYFVKQRKYLLGCCLYIGAILIHTIALSGVMVYVLYLLKKRINGVEILLFMSCMHLGAPYIISMIGKSYRNGMYLNTIRTNGGGSLFVLNILIVLALSIFLNGENKKNFYYNCYVIALGLQLIAMQFAVFNRTRLFYIWTLPLICSELIADAKNMKERNCRKIITVGCASLFYIGTFAVKYPYQYMW